MEGLFTPRRSKIFKIGVIVVAVVLVLGVGVGFYHFIYPKLISGGNGEGSSEEPNRYFVGPEYFEEVNGGSRLLAVEGVITKIDEEGIVITLGEEDYDIPRDEIGEILAIDFIGGEEQTQTRALDYKDLFVDLFISYQPAFGLITVDAGFLNNE